LVAERFGVSESTCRSIFDVKQQMLLDIREDWPMYTNFYEDISLQREGKWSDFFDNTRIVMWDMTDISRHQVLNRHDLPTVLIMLAHVRKVASFYNRHLGSEHMIYGWVL
jgi:hypothetical protein